MSEISDLCPWCLGSPNYIKYHNEVWGRPQRDSQDLFAKLCLDGQQAGLSWITILNKQNNYYKHFYDFDPEKIVRYAPRKMDRLLQEPGIIRHRGKLESIIKNARAYIEIEAAGESFSETLWQFVDGVPVQNRFRKMSEVPAQTPASENMAKFLKGRGFTFVGPTICYAFMQAVGMVNDHLITCLMHQKCADLA